jgi:hypothetical protein
MDGSEVGLSDSDVKIHPDSTVPRSIKGVIDPDKAGSGLDLTTKNTIEITDCLIVPWEVSSRGLAHLNPLWRAMIHGSSGIKS